MLNPHKFIIFFFIISVSSSVFGDPPKTFKVAALLSLSVDLAPLGTEIAKGTST